jgi:predicted metal-dependent HD superfamily phosphohydrolase
MDGPAEGDLATFLDIDLAVLGREPARYAEYARYAQR